MTKDSVTVRELYQLIDKMRDEMKEMEQRLSSQFQKSIDNHCQWANNTVEHYEGVAVSYSNRLMTLEKLSERALGILTVLGFIVPAGISLLVNWVEKVFAKN